ncbi:MAG: phytanoyl-CoA dioxygenase family protein [Myxococcales bacterium]|nr:phytanoyl-CoA dioxygenase family protein [Myxococcales bacterium]
MGLADDLSIAGYFELPNCVPNELVERARTAVERVVARGAPAAVAFALEPFWDILDYTLPHGEAALGAPAAILPAFWAWHVGTNQAGWPPHRDRAVKAFTAEGEPAAVTLWIALTDATPRNGCMYVVPAPWDLQYRNPNATAEVLSLQHLCALPAPAGTLLGWSHALLHWGGATIPDEPPRISVSFELCRADADRPEAHPRGWRPTRDERIAIVRAAIEEYAHMHQYSPDVIAAAEAVVTDLADLES